LPNLTAVGPHAYKALASSAADAARVSTLHARQAKSQMSFTSRRMVSDPGETLLQMIVDACALSTARATKSRDLQADRLSRALGASVWANSQPTARELK
jgi:hypothetical protein